ncbi:MAG: methyl-accepting chemotaxis protein [Magnetococcales bacterium]|nr:methyl-accepting chemotaxis protein [Magnetococcales bacterium]
MALKNLSVGERLGLGFGLIGALFAMVVWQYNHSLFELIDRFDHLQETQAAKKSHFLHISRYMLEARHNEKNFLSRKKIEDADRVALFVQLILEETEPLKRIERMTGSPPIADKINTHIKLYQSAFLKMVDAWKINGLSHNLGLQGRFRQTIHAIEDQAKNFKTSRLTHTLLQIRRAEKDLGLRQIPLYRDQVLEWIEVFNAQIEKSELDQKLKAGLLSALETYRSHFNSYAVQVLKHQDIHGGKGPFRETAHQLEAQLQKQFVPDLEEDILSLRRREKDYLLRGELGYVKTVQQIVLQILHNIEASKISDEDKKRLNEGLLRYETDFLALVDHDREIRDLADRMGEAIHQIEPLITLGVAEAVTEMTIATEQTRSQATNSSLIALFISLAIMLLGIIFAVYFSRRITRPVNTLTQLAELFAPPKDESDMESAPVKDEILILTQAMGRMTGHLQDIVYYFIDHTKDINTIADQLQSSIQQPLSPTEQQKIIDDLRLMSQDLKIKMRQLNA